MSFFLFHYYSLSNILLKWLEERANREKITNSTNIRSLISVVYHIIFGGWTPFIQFSMLTVFDSTLFICAYDMCSLWILCLQSSYVHFSDNCCWFLFFFCHSLVSIIVIWKNCGFYPYHVHQQQTAMRRMSKFSWPMFNWNRVHTMSQHKFYWTKSVCRYHKKNQRTDWKNDDSTKHTTITTLN